MQKIVHGTVENSIFESYLSKNFTYHAKILPAQQTMFIEKKIS